MLSVYISGITSEDRERSRGAEGSSEERRSDEGRGTVGSTVDFLSGSPVLSLPCETSNAPQRGEPLATLTLVRKGLLTQELAEWCLQTLITASARPHSEWTLTCNGQGF